MRSVGRQVMSWPEYVKAKRLRNLHQGLPPFSGLGEGGTSKNKSKISEKKALVFFVGRLDVRVKTLI